jgi:Surface antigen
VSVKLQIFKKIFLIVLLVMVIAPFFVIPGILFAASPDFNSPAYTSSNPYSSPNCTWYAWGRAKEVTGVSLPTSWGDAGDWPVSSSSIPKDNSIAVWTDAGAGHVAYVESVNVSAGTMTISEANYDSEHNTLPYAYHYDDKFPINGNKDDGRGGTQKFKGYYYLDNSNPPVVNEASITSTCLIMDCSETMSEYWENNRKIESAVDSANKMLNMIEQDSSVSKVKNTVSLVSFSNQSVTNANSSTDYNEIRSAMNGFVEEAINGGKTNLEAALNNSVNIFKSADNQGKNIKKIAILLSDGLPNVGLSTAGELIAGPVQSMKDAGITLYTIGFGNINDIKSLDENLLKDIAESTGGKYYFASSMFELSKTYVRLRHESKGQIISSDSGLINLDEAINLTPINVTKKMGDINITLIWPGSLVDLNITDPRGVKVDQNYPNSSISLNTNPIYFVINDPIPGTWSVNIYGKDVNIQGEPYEVISSTSKEREVKSYYIIIIASAAGFLFLAAILSALLVSLSKNKKKKAFIIYQGVKIPIEDKMDIGRSPTARIMINDPKVSRNHALISKAGKVYTISDLGSENGTFINGSKISTMELMSGSCIKIGDSILIFIKENKFFKNARHIK